MNLGKGMFIIILMTGIGLLILYFTSNNNNTEPKVIYKYLPRTLEEEENEPVFATEIFKTMFTQPSVWINSTYDNTIRRTEVPNKYYISQL
jgi:hypothetical protein